MVARKSAANRDARRLSAVHTPHDHKLTLSVRAYAREIARSRG